LSRMPWPFAWGDDNNDTNKDRDSDGDDSTSSSGDSSYTGSESATTVTDTDIRGIDDEQSHDTGMPSFPEFPDLYSMWAPSNMYMEYQAPSSEYGDRWEDSELKPMLTDAANNITDAWNQVSMC
jgi:hypothetical protein